MRGQGEPKTWRIPSPSPVRRVPVLEGRSGVILNRLISTARKLAALTKKQTAGPAAASSMPAKAGPNTRDRLKADELSAMALMRCSRPARSPRNAWRTGISNALIRPPASERAYTHSMVMTSNAVRSPSASASARKSDWSTSRARRLFTRPATTPPYSVNNSTGRALKKVTSPTCSAESVSRSASHPSATVCIQVPQSEMLCPV